MTEAVMWHRRAERELAEYARERRAFRQVLAVAAALVVAVVLLLAGLAQAATPTEWAPSWSAVVEAQAAGTYVRRGGDVMSGNLRIVSPAANQLLLTGSGGIAGVCFDSPTCATRVYYQGTTIAFAGPLVTFQQNTVTTGLHQWVGVATGSLPTCNAGLPGALHFDTTNQKLVHCNGANFLGWHGLTQATWTAYSPLATTSAARILAITSAQTIWNVRAIGAVISVAGTGAGNVTYGMYDENTSGFLCSTTIACAGAAGLTATSTCNGATGNPTSAAGHVVDLRIDSSGCTTAPLMTVSATYE